MKMQQADDKECTFRPVTANPEDVLAASTRCALATCGAGMMPPLATLFCKANASSAVVIMLLHPHAGPHMVSAA